MTTPAFNHLITFDTVSLSVEHHLNELEQVATDLRNERALAVAPVRRRPNRLRIGIGSMLINAGAALVASPARRSYPAR